MIPEDARLGAG